MTVADLLDRVRGENTSRVDGPGVQFGPVGGMRGGRRRGVPTTWRCRPNCVYCQCHSSLSLRMVVGWHSRHKMDAVDFVVGHSARFSVAHGLRLRSWMLRVRLGPIRAEQSQFRTHRSAFDFRSRAEFYVYGGFAAASPGRTGSRHWPVDQVHSRPEVSTLVNSTETKEV
jgi:hypothetical protein